LSSGEGFCANWRIEQVVVELQRDRRTLFFLAFEVSVGVRFDYVLLLTLLHIS
jgi:hypothetical protein